MQFERDDSLEKIDLALNYFRPDDALDFGSSDVCPEAKIYKDITK